MKFMNFSAAGKRKGFLALLGLAKLNKLEAALDSAAQALSFAESVADKSAEAGNLVIAGDYTLVEGCYIPRLIIMIGTQNTTIRNCYIGVGTRALTAKGEASGSGIDLGYIGDPDAPTA